MSRTPEFVEKSLHEWRPLRREASTGVEARVLLRRPRLVIATLRFDRSATIDEHAAPFSIDVACLSGEGFVSVGGMVESLRSGETVTWPAGVPHRLWTDGTPMETLMVEHHEP